MELDVLLRSLEATSIATAIREGSSLFPWIEAVHVLAITIVVGSIAVLDLRLVGVAWADRALQPLMADALRCTLAAFAIAAVSGALLFSSRALDYAHNRYFQAKFAFMLLAGINMAVFHLFGARKLESWGIPPNRTPGHARVAGAVSLLLWIVVVACGRWVGFTLSRGMTG
jgi:hypothetical protein